MVRYLLIGLAVLIIVGVIIARFILVNNLNNNTDVTPSPREVPLSTQSGQLTKQVNDILKKAKQPVDATGTTPTPDPSYTALETRVKVLEVAIADLRQQLRVTQQNTSGSTTTTSSTKTPVYLPIGSGGSSTSPTYSDAPGVEISLDPADYPGITSATLEIQLKISQQGQTASARLYNLTDKTPLANSDVSTTSYSGFALVTSSNLTLPVGRKTYRLQLKSSGNQTDNQFARLRINF